MPFICEKTAERAILNKLLDAGVFGYPAVQGDTHFCFEVNCVYKAYENLLPCFP